MTAPTPREDAPDVRNLLAELEELVDDLGLDSTAPSGRASAERPRDRRRERRLAAVKAELAAAAEELPPGTEDDLGDDQDIALAGDLDLPDHYTMLPADAAELAALASAVSGAPGTDVELVPFWETADDETVERVPLWDAFSPELEARPARAWSPAAAMEVVEPAAPPAPAAAPRQARLVRVAGAVRRRLFTAVTVAAVLIAAAVLVITHVQLGQTSGPATPQVKAAFEVTTMRTVDATSPSDVAQAPTRSSFPAGVTRVFMDVVYRNAAQGDTLRLVISLLPPAGSGGTPVQVGDQTHQLPTGGEIAVTIQGPSSGFSPGDYTVSAFHDGHLEQSLTFSVEAAPPAVPTLAPIAPAATPLP
ncbi:MAG TPA: hypothetical protein VFC09_11385 [Candidatus Dormibacteraeota bacterium]|nr:hypothetical protein [Candidatus Dormibacteraeota bacterium]